MDSMGFRRAAAGLQRQGSAVAIVGIFLSFETLERVSEKVYPKTRSQRSKFLDDFLLSRRGLRALNRASRGVSVLKSAANGMDGANWSILCMPWKMLPQVWLKPFRGRESWTLAPRLCSAQRFSPC